jgi:hypothetical protein
MVTRRDTVLQSRASAGDPRARCRAGALVRHRRRRARSGRLLRRQGNRPCRMAAKRKAIAAPLARKARRHIAGALAHGAPSPPSVLPCMECGHCMRAGASIAAADHSPMLRSWPPTCRAWSGTTRRARADEFGVPPSSVPSRSSFGSRRRAYRSFSYASSTRRQTWSSGPSKNSSGR